MISVIVGVAVSAILGLLLVGLKTEPQIEFVDGSSLSIITDKTDFDLSEEVTIKIINSGTTPLVFPDASYGLKITGLDGRLLYSPITIQVLTTLEPKEEITFKWDQTKSDGDLVTQGRYKITSSALDNLENIVEKSVTINIHK